MLSDPASEAPTCGVVIEKKAGEDAEKLCGEPVVTVIYETDPDQPARVIAVILLCKRHDEVWEQGEALILRSDDGGHIAVNKKGATNDVNDESAGPGQHDPASSVS